jgi:hypothetical protein
MKAIIGGIIGGFLGIITGLLIQLFALHSSLNELRSNLIEKGIAEWILNKNGNATFQIKGETK